MNNGSERPHFTSDDSDFSDVDGDVGDDNKSVSSLNPNGKLEIVEGVQPELQNSPLESEAASEFFFHFHFLFLYPHFSTNTS